MVNYALVNWTTRGSIETVMAAMEAQLETVDDSKTIYVSQVARSGNEFITPVPKE